MAQTTLYTGISSKGIQSILKNGIPAFRNKYDEARSVLSKYINPEILTDEFLETNKEYIGWLRYRFSQFQEGAGIFCTKEEKLSPEELNERLAQAHDLILKKGLSETETKNLEDSLKRTLKRQEETPLHDAILYAQSSANDLPEYERYIVSDLKTLKENIVELEEKLETLSILGHSKSLITKDIEQRLACRKILLKNLKPEYKDKNGNVKISKEKGNFPIILQIKGNLPLCFENEQEVRIQGDLKPDDITGVAFVPDKPNEKPLFLPKEEFLKQLQQKQETNSIKQTASIKSFLAEHLNQKMPSSQKTQITPSALEKAKTTKQVDR